MSMFCRKLSAYAILIRKFNKGEIMNKKLTWDEIKQQYDGQWVELIDFDWDEAEPDPQAGVVRCHSKDRKEFHRLILQDPVPAEAALVYVGEIFPKKGNIIFSANLHQYKLTNK